MQIQAVVYVLLLAVLMGTVTVASRFCLGQFDPIMYSALRIFFAALAYWCFYLFRIGGRKIPRDKNLWVRSALTGILGSGLTVILIVSAMQYLSSGVTATLVTIFPVIVVILAHFFLTDERLTPLKITGVLLAVSGTVLMIARGETGLSGVEKANPLGYIMILGGSLIAGFVTIYMRKKMVDYDTIDVVSIRMTSAALVAIPAAFLMEGLDLSRVNAVGWGVFVYATFVMFSGFLLGFFILKRYGATLSAMSDYISPIIAAMGGAMLLDEKVTTGMLAGMGLILVGVVLINMPQKYKTLV